MAALVECGTHVVLEAELGGCRVGELALSARLPAPTARSVTRNESAVVLSSKTPDGVHQQIWAHLLVHHALRSLMCRTAATPGPGSRPAVLHRHPAFNPLQCHHLARRLFPLNTNREHTNDSVYGSFCAPDESITAVHGLVCP